MIITTYIAISINTYKYTSKHNVALRISYEIDSSTRIYRNPILWLSALWRKWEVADILGHKVNKPDIALTN